MEKSTLNALSKMRQNLIDFLNTSNTIESQEWLDVIKSIQKEREKLKRIENLARLGNVYVILFFLKEILEEIVRDEKPP